MISRYIQLLIAAALAGYSLACGAATSITTGTDPAKFVIQGRLFTPTEVIDGKLVIDGDTITCVGTCDSPPGAWLLKVSNGFVFPGFIDAHNHVAYNILGKWTPSKFYERRSKWQSSAGYTAFKEPYNRLKATLFCEMVKYGEIKALISGVTTIEGTAPSRTCFRTLIRNAENQNQLGLPANYIRTFILDIHSFNGNIDWNRTKAFVVHLAEGMDQISRDEFEILKQKGLLTSATVIIHGTAFKDAQFKEMADAGAKLIWSPRSNLVLYDDTTDIRLAYQHNVLVSLGVDWNPTGSDSIFDELRVAEQVNEERFDNVIPASDWVKLVTLNPAKALALDGFIGQLAPNMKADITVLRKRNDDPNLSLLASRLQDVEMVWVGGKLLYGNRTVVERIRPGQCEALTVYGARKRVCVKDDSTSIPGGDQTLSTIRARLLEQYPALAPLTP